MKSALLNKAAAVLVAGVALMSFSSAFADWRYPDRHDRHDSRWDRDRHYNRGGRYASPSAAISQRMSALHDSVISYQARVDRQRRDNKTHTAQYKSDMYRLRLAQNELASLEQRYYRR